MKIASTLVPYRPHFSRNVSDHDFLTNMRHGSRTVSPKGAWCCSNIIVSYGLSVGYVSVMCGRCVSYLCINCELFVNYQWVDHRCKIYGRYVSYDKLVIYKAPQRVRDRNRCAFTATSARRPRNPRGVSQSESDCTSRATAAARARGPGGKSSSFTTPAALFAVL